MGFVVAGSKVYLGRSWKNTWYILVYLCLSWYVNPLISLSFDSSPLLLGVWKMISDLKKMDHLPILQATRLEIGPIWSHAWYMFILHFFPKNHPSHARCKDHCMFNQFHSFSKKKTFSNKNRISENQDSSFYKNWLAILGRHILNFSGPRSFSPCSSLCCSDLHGCGGNGWCMAGVWVVVLMLSQPV